MITDGNTRRPRRSTIGEGGRDWLRLTIGLCAIGILLGCDSSESPDTRISRTKPPELADPDRPPAQIPPPQATGPSSPEASRNRHGPEEGRAIYALVCVICHGEAGNGEGVATDQFMVTPVRHDDGAYMNQLSNDYLFEIIRDGGTAVGKSPDMKPWSEFYSDDQIWSLVSYIRGLAQPPFDGAMP